MQFADDCDKLADAIVDIREKQLVLTDVCC